MDNKGLLILTIVLGVIAGGEAFYVSTLQGKVKEHGILLQEYDSLQQRYEEIEAQSSTLTDQLDSLRAEYASLVDSHSELEESHSSLQDVYLALSTNYTSLQTSYDYLDSGFAALKADYEDFQKYIEKVVDEVNMRLGFGESQRHFVAPDDPAVGNLTIEITGSLGSSKDESERWVDIRKIFDWVDHNIHFSLDSPYPHIYAQTGGDYHWHKECFKFPNETIVDGNGDCEDQALLLLSMLLRYNDTANYFCIRYSSDSMDHMAVAVSVTGDNLVILDPSGNYYSGISGHRIVFETAEDAIDDWFKRWGYSNMRVVCAFNDGFFEAFENTDQFFDWFHDKYA